jgi:hypothetical protein
MDRITTATWLSALLIAGAVMSRSAWAENEYPPRKPGLWQVDMAMTGGPMPPQQMKMCIDQGTDAEMFKMGMNASQGMCDKPDIRRSGSTVTVSTVCRMGDSQMSTQAVTKFTGDTAYHTDANTRFNPPMAGREQSTVTQDAKWTGPCPTGMVAGDVMMPNGMKMNMKQMMGNKP